MAFTADRVTSRRCFDKAAVVVGPRAISSNYALGERAKPQSRGGWHGHLSGPSPAKVIDPDSLLALLKLCHPR